MEIANMATAPSVRLEYKMVRPQIQGLLTRHQYMSALSQLIKLRERVPFNPDLLDDMATCYWKLKDEKTAKSLSRLVAYHLKTNSTAWRKLAFMMLESGEMDVAKKYFEKALKHQPDDLVALSGLCRIRPFRPRSERAMGIRRLLKTDLSAQDKALAHNILGRVEEAAGNYKGALSQFGKSKQYGEVPFDATLTAALVSRQEAEFAPQILATSTSRSEARLPFFVVGMPRSGTTLVESILCRHPDVTTVGETSALRATLFAYRKVKAIEDPWGWQKTLRSDDLDALRAMYWEATDLDSAAKTGAYILDKSPLNIFNLGFAKALFPNARFVFMSRHPLDVGLSNFTTDYSESMPFTRDFAATAEMTRLVYRSALDYRRKLGSQFRWQSYSALVRSSEAQIRQLLDHLGLSFDPACLSPEKREGAVSTASFMQVREKINTKGLDRWRNYEPHLGPLIDGLGGWNWIREWEALDTAAGAL